MAIVWVPQMFAEWLLHCGRQHVFAPFSLLGMGEEMGLFKVWMKLSFSIFLL